MTEKEDDLPLLLSNWTIKYNPKNSTSDNLSLSECFVEGIIYNHHLIEDGSVVITDHIQSIVDNKLTVVDGSVFYLLEPDEKYAKFLAEQTGETIIDLKTIRHNALN